MMHRVHCALHAGACLLAILLAGCATTSTIAFRASPTGDDHARLSCLASSSGSCAFDVPDAAVQPAGIDPVAVGHEVTIAVPALGTAVRGCVAARTFASCSTVHVARGGTATASSHARCWQ